MMRASFPRTCASVRPGLTAFAFVSSSGACDRRYLSLIFTSYRRPLACEISCPAGHFRRCLLLSSFSSISPISASLVIDLADTRSRSPGSRRCCSLFLLAVRDAGRLSATRVVRPRSTLEARTGRHRRAFLLAYLLIFATASSSPFQFHFSSFTLSSYLFIFCLFFFPFSSFSSLISSYLTLLLSFSLSFLSFLTPPLYCARSRSADARLVTWPGPFHATFVSAQFFLFLSLCAHIWRARSRLRERSRLRALCLRLAVRLSRRIPAP